MKDPVSGVFRVSDWYDAHPNSTPSGTRLTGVIVADGLPPTPAEAPVDHKGKWVGHRELPVTVDRADPSNFRIEWDQVITQSWQATARQRALDEATKLAGGQAAMDMPPGPAGPAGSAGQFGGAFGGQIDNALRSMGIDLSNASVSFVTPEQSRAMMSAFFGNQENQFGSPVAPVAATVPATGVVRDVRDVVPPVPLPPGMSQADITLDVRRPDGSTYPATTRIGFRTPARRAAIATIGTTLPLLVDQADPGRLSIDIARLNLP